MTDRTSGFLQSPYVNLEYEPRVQETQSVDTQQDAALPYLFFSVRESLFGVHVALVASVKRSSCVSEVPFIRHHGLIGFLAEHGQIIPVLDLGALWRHDTSSVEGECAIFVLVRHRGLLTAVMTNQILGIGSVTPISQELETLGSLKFQSGVYRNRPAILLEPNSLIDAAQRGVL
jgi:chemotaxis signal transduction protein